MSEMRLNKMEGIITKQQMMMKKYELPKNKHESWKVTCKDI